MKLNFLAIALFLGHFAFAQSSADNSINNKNYYDHFQGIKGHSVNWLRTSDAVPVIIDELLKNGIPYYIISIGQLLKLTDTTRLVVTVSFKKADKEFGMPETMLAQKNEYPIHGDVLKIAKIGRR